MSSSSVTVSVHRRIDAEGYVVRLVVVQGGQEKVARFPTETFLEARELCDSIRGLAATGAVDALLPEPDEA